MWSKGNQNVKVKAKTTFKQIINISMLLKHRSNSIGTLDQTMYVTSTNIKLIMLLQKYQTMYATSTNICCFNR